MRLEHFIQSNSKHQEKDSFKLNPILQFFCVLFVSNFTYNTAFNTVLEVATT